MGIEMNTFAAVVVAAGQGRRAGGPVPKQYRPFEGRPLIWWSLSSLAACERIGPILAVIDPRHRSLHEEAVAGLDLLPPVNGGATRQESVLRGLQALHRHDPDFVFIHDAARPFVSSRLVGDLIRVLEERNYGVIPVIGITDTVKFWSDGRVTGTADRNRLVCAQTPQAFPYGGILMAHEAARAETFTDDAAVAEAHGMTVGTVEGDASNIKVTREEDFAMAREFAEPLETSAGSGYDAHAFIAGDHVMLCGVRIDHDRTLEGDSDGDAGLHALVDAILGALGEGDLGHHFPVGDGTWRGRPSGDLVKVALAIMARHRATLLHADITLICQKPRLAPHQAAMKEAVAGLLRIGSSRVNIKVTSTDGLGFIGRNEGIAACATVTIRRPPP